MSEKNRGEFIVFEGPSMSGKSTVLRRLESKLLQQGAVILREPGGTAFGEQIRNAVQGTGEKYDYPIDPVAQALAYSTSRRQLVSEKIIPTLKDGKNVYLDRFWYSTMAYQCYGYGGITEKKVVKMTQIATGGLEPDLVLYFQCSVPTILERRKRKDDLDRHDVLGDKFFKRVVAGYEKVMKRYVSSDRLVIIDAEQDKELVYARVHEELNRRRILE